jgi:hypothetical protein
MISEKICCLARSDIVPFTSDMWNCEVCGQENSILDNLLCWDLRGGGIIDFQYNEVPGIPKKEKNYFCIKFSE